MTFRFQLPGLALLCVLSTAPAQAQVQASGPPPQTPAGAAVADQPDPDLRLVVGEPDFTLAALPTSLRMPTGRFVFRLTHRFARPINSGTAGDFVGSLFGLDSSARVGLELRYGLRPGMELVVHRTNARAIQLLGQYELAGQRADQGLTLDAVTAVEGQNNFRERYSETVGAIVSRRFGTRGAIYAEPFAVFHSNPVATATGSRDTLMVGLGGRFRLGRGRTYVVAELVPRLAGYRPGATHVSVGIEKRVGGHMFQLNVSNSFDTTLAAIARGGSSTNDWYIGFNLTRRLY